MVYSSLNFEADPWKEEEERKRYQDGVRYEQQKAAEDKAYKETVDAQVFQEDSADDLINPDTGKLKSSFEQKDPKEFGPKENFQEGINAVTGAAVDIADSIASIPQKIVDPRFYTDISGEPYRPAWLPSDYVNPMTKTVWGNLIRRVGEFGGLMALTRRAAGAGARVAPGAAKAPLNYLAKGPTMTPQPAPVAGDKLGNFQRSMAVKGGNLGKNIAYGAAIGAPAELVASTSTEANLARELIRIRPDWEDALEPFATHDQMTPIQRSAYNMLESLGIGPVLDIAGEGARGLFKAIRGSRGATTAARSAGAASGGADDIATTRALMQKKLDLRVEIGAQQQVERAFAKDPLSNRPWKALSADEKFAAKQAYAKRNKLDWGDDTDPAIKRQESQDTNETDVAMRRLELDPQGEKGFDGYINTGGESIQGRANSTAKSFVDTIESTRQIYTDARYADGTPNNVTTRRWLDLIGDNMPMAEYVERMTKNDPTFNDLVERLRASGKRIDEYTIQALDEVAQAMGGRKYVFQFSDEEFENLFVRTNNFEGRTYFTDLDIAKAAVVTNALNREIRDFATIAKSVEGQMDITAKDGIFDQIMARWVAVGRGIKESNYLRHAALGNLRASGKADLTKGLAEIGESVKGTAQMIREAVEGDKSDDLLKLVLDAFAANDKLQTWADLDTFFSRKLGGYRDGDVHYQNAIMREMGSMMVNSVISGPKTPVRAAFGTGFVTFSRPVFSAIGASLRGDQRTLKASMHQIGTMFEATSDAWKVFKKQLKSNFENADIPDLGTVATRYNRTESDLDWEILGDWVQKRGSEAQQAAYGRANALRNMNRNPLLTWSSRVMNASDLAFHTIIGKQKASGDAFLRAYDEFTEAGIPITDKTFPDLLRKYEGALTDEIFDDSGMLRDSFAKFAADEAAMTKELPNWVAAIENGFAQQPLLRPFMLFTRTAYNALELTGKHTPFINNFIKEVHNIKNLPTGHSDLLQYGIRNADEHEAAKALIRGREAMGTMTIMGATGLYLSGRLTGNGPQDKQLRDAWMQSGWTPRSVLLPTPDGPKWISYDSLEPFNGFLAFVADVGDVSQQMGESWTEAMLGRASYLIQANIINRSFFFGLSQLSDLFNGQASDLQRVAANLLNNYFPLSSMRNEIGRFFNPGMRELEAGFFDNIKNRNLWAGEVAELPYRYDVLNGQPLRMWDVPTRMWNAVMPFQINHEASETRQMLWRSLYDVKTTVNTMPDNVGEIPTSLKSRWQYLIGKQNVEGQLAKLFQSKQIQASIAEMEADRDAGKPNDAMTYQHNTEIKRIFTRAKKNALLELQQDAEASALLAQAKREGLAAELRKKGRYKQEEQLQQLLQSPLK